MDFMCPMCMGQAKQVPASVVFKEDRQASYRKIWYCDRDKAWCEMDQQSERPIGTMANAEVHLMRDQIRDALLSSGMTRDEFRKAMGRKPWNDAINGFGLEGCQKAMEILDMLGPAADIDAELLS